MQFNREFTVPEHIKVPREGYRFWPTKDQIIYGSGKKLNRLIFERQVLTEFENDKLKRLEQVIEEEKIRIPDDWTRNHILRFCYGTK